jgi:ABC-type nitrate/sulfonate/bicarbonate transport system substrate-binding protein
MRRTLIAVAAVAVAAIAAVAAVTLTAGNGRSSALGPAWPNSTNPGEADGPVTLRLGFVTDISQAPALVGLQDGVFASALHGSGITLQPVPFRTAAAEATALATGQLDAAYASATTILADLARPSGTKIAVVSGASAGNSPVNLLATRTFLSAHSESVLDLVRGQVKVNDFINHNLLGSAAAYAAELTALTGQRLTASAVGTSLARVRFTDDPAAASLAAMVRGTQSSAARAALPTLYDIAPLDLLLRMEGERPVTA